ncbi:HLH domain containing protein [Trichuris trichiura]|uniref:HLH domain containing protein n=1 Tax=Trichuris trichiura TaxID=36087 RepID=A0A077Z8L1_TRITR|nr:HLH domain containing protein [Trichuris trichiura]
MFEPVIGNVGTVDSSTDRKKQVHLKCEKMRREAIKVGYNELKDMLPPEAAPVGYKLTNASILYRGMHIRKVLIILVSPIAFIAAEFLKKLKLTEKQQSEEISKLHSQLVALQIICQNYAQMAVQKNPSFDTLETDTAPYLKFELVVPKVFDDVYQSKLH